MVAEKEMGNHMRKVLLLAAAALSAHATSFYLTIAGAPGEPDYEQRFSGWVSDFNKAISTEAGAKVDSLVGKDATKAAIQAKLASIASQSKADDTFVLLLIGHGSYDDIDYKFNIVGPDISATELASALDKIPARQLIVDATSASGGAIPRLQKDKRIIITATKSGSERNATTFARFWVEAFRDPAADADKNQTLTALEAYKYASQKTKDFFATQKHLATEHSLLEDTGKKNGENDPSTVNGQGLLASRFAVMHLGTAAAALADPSKQAAIKKKEELENSIEDLKYRKSALDQQTYDRQMRQLLLELAKVQASLDQ
jgi:hypothetical protein